MHKRMLPPARTRMQARADMRAHGREHARLGRRRSWPWRTAWRAWRHAWRPYGSATACWTGQLSGRRLRGRRQRQRWVSVRLGEGVACVNAQGLRQPAVLAGTWCMWAEEAGRWRSSVPGTSRMRCGARAGCVCGLQQDGSHATQPPMCPTLGIMNAGVVHGKLSRCAQKCLCVQVYVCILKHCKRMRVCVLASHGSVATSNPWTMCVCVHGQCPHVARIKRTCEHLGAAPRHGPRAPTSTHPTCVLACPGGDAGGGGAADAGPAEW